MQANRVALRDYNGLRLPIRGLKYPPSLIDYKESANEILAGIFIEECGYLLPHSQIVSLRTGQELFADGERNEYVYFPETCVISHLYNLSDGSTTEIAMVGSEGMSGLCSLFGSHLNAHQSRVTIGGSACRINAKVLSQAFSNGGRLQKLLFNYFNQYLNQVSQRVICQSFHAVEKRLSSWLLMVSDRTRHKRLPTTHEQLSLILGAQRPTLSVIAKGLRDAGLIMYSRGNLEITDRLGLENLACECYSAARIYEQARR